MKFAQHLSTHITTEWRWNLVTSVKSLIINWAIFFPVSHIAAHTLVTGSNILIMRSVWKSKFVSIVLCVHRWWHLKIKFVKGTPRSCWAKGNIYKSLANLNFHAFCTHALEELLFLHFIYDFPRYLLLKRNCLPWNQANENDTDENKKVSRQKYFSFQYYCNWILNQFKV